MQLENDLSRTYELMNQTALILRYEVPQCGGCVFITALIFSNSNNFTVTITVSCAVRAVIT